MEQPPDQDRTASVSGWKVETTPGLPAFPVGACLSHRYRVSRFIARGGMGEVYEVEDEELGIAVALKTIARRLADDIDALRRFKREVLLARSISHPNVCRIFDFGRHQDENTNVSFLTMELLEGESLRDRIRACGRFTGSEAIALVEQMAAALEAAHRAGVVHRDFKSANVMVVPSRNGDRAVITDFGIAQFRGGGEEGARPASPLGRLAEDSGAHTSHADEATVSVDFVGTPAYMAPEQVLGLPAGPAADLYALGVVMFEMVTGTLPFEGTDAASVATARLRDDPPLLRQRVCDLDARWEATVARCLSREVGARFGRAEEISAALRHETVLPPASSVASAPRVSLPAERDVFVRRERELASLDQVWASSARLVTIVGPAGAGKTRVALHHTWKTRHSWPGGCFWCDLAEASSADDIARTVAAGIGVELGRTDPITQLGHAIAGRGRCLLVLDNVDRRAEDVVAALSVWIDRADDARFLVTSRERLRLPYEVALPLDALDEEAALEMLVNRAAAHRPGFCMDPRDEAALRRLARELDGLPLALELAAARLRFMSPVQLAERLGDRFRLLQSGTRKDRHSTLLAALEASWDPLTPWERSAFAQCSVFEGGFDVDAAEQVIDLSASPEAPWALDVLQSLVDKHLLRVSTGADSVGDPRFGVYATFREFASERLHNDFPEIEAEVEIRHGQCFAERCSDEALDALNRAGGSVRFRALERELGNLIAACRKAIVRNATSVAVGAFVGAWSVLDKRGPLPVAVELGARVLTLPTLSSAERARTLDYLGRAQWRVGKAESGKARYQEALVLYRADGNRRAEGVVLGNLASIEKDLGNLAESRALALEALAIHRDVGNRRAEGLMRVSLSTLDSASGSAADAVLHAEAARDIFVRAGDRAGEGVALCCLGVSYAQTGRVDMARDHYERSLTASREVGDRRIEGINLNNLSILLIEEGRWREAEERLEHALLVHRDLGDRLFEGLAVSYLGCCAMETHRFEQAEHLLKESVAILHEIGNRRFEGSTLHLLGLLEHRRASWPEACEYLERARVLVREAGDRRSEANVMGDLGSVMARQGRIEEARNLQDQAESTLRGLSDPLSLGKLLCSRGETEFHAGERARALASLLEAREILIALHQAPGSELARAVERLASAVGAGP